VHFAASAEVFGSTGAEPGAIAERAREAVVSVKFCKKGSVV